jgi:hypothetical protein
MTCAFLSCIAAIRHIKVHSRKLSSIVQFAPGSRRRWIAVVCLLLVLCFSAMEATHSHPEAQLTGNATHCAICISAHNSAAVVTFHLSGITLAVISATAPFRISSTASAPEISLFSRPPPIA